MDETRVRITSSGNGRIEISGLTPKEEDHITQSISSGGMWIRAENGRIVAVSRYEPLPGLTEDLEMSPFWPTLKSNDPDAISVQTLLFDEERYGNIHISASIYIKHLCGHHLTEENLRRQIELVTSYGFEQMRSRRGADGKYWETWYLPGTWTAKGELKEHLKMDPNKDIKHQLEKAIKFLSSHVLFGQLDVAIQRLAATFGD